MAYKYMGNVIKAIKSQIENTYIQGYSDGKAKAQREYSKHGKNVKIEILSENEFDSMSNYYKSWPVKAWCECGMPLNRLDYTFCPYCGGLIVRGDEKNGR